MKSMLLRHVSIIEADSAPLEYCELPTPEITEHQVLIEVRACGVCHTELDEIEGRTVPPRLPIILGHQAIGEVIQIGSAVKTWEAGDRVGVAWIGGACGLCEYCQSGRENLCAEFQATGRDLNGGYAEYMAADERFVCSVPESLSDLHAAPLLCAGAIGYRSLRLAELQNGQRLGLTGFGASAHLVLQLVTKVRPDTAVYVFARDQSARELALSMGAAWAGDISDTPPQKLHAVIDTTPAWKPIVEALRHLMPGGKMIVNAIGKESADKSALLELDYQQQLWLEKELKTVANVTRADVQELMDIAASIRLEPKIESYPLRAANQALIDLKFRPFSGAKVLDIAQSSSQESN